MGNGERFETYVIYGPRGSGAFELNGATAHLGKVGDRLTIMSFTWVDGEEAARHKPSGHHPRRQQRDQEGVASGRASGKSGIRMIPEAESRPQSGTATPIPAWSATHPASQLPSASEPWKVRR